MLLNIENVSKSYGDRRLLNGVSLYMKPGDRLGVIGVNGCGKSTLLKVAAGREEPDSGSVSYDPNVRLGYLSQTPEDDRENTVLEQVYAGLEPNARALMEYEAVEILTRLGITDTGAKMGTLSGGQRKRVALASALVHPADLLILDEGATGVASGMLDEDLLRSLVEAFPKDKELVITGSVPEVWMIETADYVTDMEKIKHPFDTGVKARKGIEF